MESIDIALPINLANMTLPEPSLVNYWRNAENRIFFIVVVNQRFPGIFALYHANCLCITVEEGCDLLTLNALVWTKYALTDTGRNLILVGPCYGLIIIGIGYQITENR